MINKSIKTVVLTASVCVAGFSVSHAREFAEIYTDCGLGAMIAPNNDAVAAVTNVTWDFGTTAILTNMSSPDTCNGGQQRTAAFIYQSYDSIASDLSKGSGEYLDALLTLAGYEEDSKKEAMQFLREDFKKAIQSSEYEKLDRYQKAEQLFGILYGEVAVS